MSHCCPRPTCRRGWPEGPTKVIGHGWFPVPSGRRRRYRCLGCGGTFSSRVGTAYYRFRCSRRTFDRVAHLAVEGLSRAAIARIEGVGWNTVDRLSVYINRVDCGRNRASYLWTDWLVRTIP